MRKREFRPTLDDRLENRLVLNGHMAVKFTTAAYAAALDTIDTAVTAFNNSSHTVADYISFQHDLKAASKSIPYGGKALFPSLIQTVANFTSAGQLNNVSAALDGVVKNYIQINTRNGVIRYIQSGVSLPTDGDIPTSGHVPRSKLAPRRLF